uniref:Uncharacterized protein n=1 Tax=Avena sativa TaxID=4498 RepID=A0ACD6ASA0_AVESA
MARRAELQLLLLSMLLVATPAHSAPAGTIVFTTLGRSRYSFDIFALPLNHLALSSSSSFHAAASAEVRLTDGISVNYNGNFAPSSDALLFVSERNGSHNLYLSPAPKPPTSRREALEDDSPTPLLPWIEPAALRDRPSLTRDGSRLVYVSTALPANAPRRSWAAVYSARLPLSSARAPRRLTPPGVADFSPAVSPSGDWTAAASPGAAGWAGEVQDLRTDVYVFRTDDGSRRTLVVKDGGWPCWADEATLFFHRRDADGWYGVYRAKIEISDALSAVSSVERITPPGFHAFTPAASPGAPGLVAVATRRPGSDYRHIEVVDLSSGTDKAAYLEVTRPVAPRAHHFNPFVSPDGARIGYHRCRGSGNGDSPLLLESLRSPSAPDAFSLFRIDGSYPSFSPDGKRIAYVGLPGLYVVNSDGSGGRRKIFSGNAFPTSWDWKRKGVIYTSIGPDFASESTEVDVVAVSLSLSDEDTQQVSIKKLSVGGKNNAFPSPSPDGKWLVFRSGRSGHKNLYIMDAEDGEAASGIRRLTDGPWSDTMCNWSPDGEWIAFASDRHNPGGGSFSIYMVHPNGTGLRRVVHSADGGRTNHPWFSPDSKSLVFTSDLAAVSAEPIANPHHYQPYGEIFTVNIDGSGLQRLTHNSFEDGTPAWTPYFLEPRNVAETLQASGRCAFHDCYWLDIDDAQPGDDGLRYAHGNKIGC